MSWILIVILIIVVAIAIAIWLIPCEGLREISSGYWFQRPFPSRHFIPKPNDKNTYIPARYCELEPCHEFNKKFKDGGPRYQQFMPNFYKFAWRKIYR